MLLVGGGAGGGIPFSIPPGTSMIGSSHIRCSLQLEMMEEQFPPPRTPKLAGQNHMVTKTRSH